MKTSNPQSPVMFYEAGEAYDIFSNVTNMPVTMSINGITYSAASSEAIYQGLKGPKTWYLLNDPNAYGGRVQKLGKAETAPIYHTTYNTPNPYLATYNPGTTVSVKEQLMYDICMAKVTQYPQMLKALLETGDRLIVENTSLADYDDSFWGNGLKGDGKNALGKVWMAIREELRTELQQTKQIEIRTALSPNLAMVLGHTHMSQHNSKVITQDDLAKTQASILASTSAPKQTLKDFATNMMSTKPKKYSQTLKVNDIEYGISESGEFYIKGIGRDKRPISIYVDTQGNITENGRAVQNSGYADYALKKIRAHEASQGQDSQPQRSRSSTPPSRSSSRQNSPQQTLQSFASEKIKSMKRGTSQEISTDQGEVFKYGVSGSNGGFYIESTSRDGTPFSIYVDKEKGEVTERGGPVPSGYADYALKEIRAHEAGQSQSQQQHQSRSPSPTTSFSPRGGSVVFPAKPTPTPPSFLRRMMNKVTGRSS